LILLNNCWNRSLAEIFGFFKFLLQIATVIATYATLRLYDQLNFAIYIANPILLVTFLLEDTVATAGMAEIYEKSKNLKSALADFQFSRSPHPLKKTVAKDRRKKTVALKPIQCKAILFFFERKTKLLVIGLILNLTAYALLSL